MNRRAHPCILIPALLPALVLTAGCAYIEQSTSKIFGSETPTQASSSVEEGGQAFASGDPRSAAPVSGEDGDIEIVWEIPRSTVDAYLIRYGERRDDLAGEIKVSTGDLTRYEDPTYGFVYRYNLKGLPKEKPVFVSVAAVQGDLVSAPSEVFEVKPLG